MASSAAEQARAVFDLGQRLKGLERSSQLENSTVGTDDEPLSVADAVADAADVASSFGTLQDVLDQASDDVAAAGQASDEAAAAAAQAGEDGLAAAEQAQEAADLAVERADEAVTAAEQAQKDADDAVTAGKQATTAANQATEAAQTATTTAGNAAQKATDASKVAADAQSAADGAATAANAAALLSGSVSNPIFANWSGTFPDDLEGWGDDRTVVKETAIVRTPPTALRFTTSLRDQQAGLHLKSSFFPGMANYEYVTVVLDFYLVAGDLNGAGVIIDWISAGGSRAVVSLPAEFPNATPGRWYHLSKLVPRPNPNFDNMSGYIMGNWAGIGTPASPVDIIFDSLIVRASTREEITAVSAAGAAATAQTAAGAAQTTADGKNAFTRASVSPQDLSKAYTYDWTGTPHASPSLENLNGGAIRSNHFPDPNAKGHADEWGTYYDPARSFDDTVDILDGRSTYVLTTASTDTDSYPQGLIGQAHSANYRNQTVSASVYMKAPQGQQLTVAGRTSTAEGQSMYTVIATGQWQLVGVTYTVPNDVDVPQAGIQVIVGRPAGHRSAVLKFSGMLVELAATIGSRIDGDLPDTYGSLIAGKVKGDRWFVTDAATGVVSAQFVWDGLHWTPETIADSVIANLSAAKITTGILDADRIGANSITALKIVGRTITAAEIAVGTIQAVNIAAGTITAALMVAETITSREIAADAITARTIAADAILARNIKAAEITAGKLATDSVVAANIVAGTITGVKIQANAITAREIAAGTITTDLLNSNAINGMTITGATIQTADPAALTPRLTFAGATSIGYAGTAAANKEFYRLTTDSGGYIKMTSQDSARAAAINGVRWNGGGIIFTNPLADTGATGYLAAPGIGWFTNLGSGATDELRLLFGTPSRSGGEGSPNMDGLALYGTGVVTLTGGSKGDSQLALTDGSAILSTKDGKAPGPSVELTGVNATSQIYLRGGNGNAIRSSVVMYGTGRVDLTGGYDISYTGASTLGARLRLEANTVTLLTGGTSYSSAPNLVMDDTYFAFNVGRMQSLPTYTGTVASGRAVVANSAGTFGYVSSTKRHKYDDREVVVTDELIDTVLMKIKARTYLHDADLRENPQRQYGFFAEDLDEYGLTELVDYGADADGEMTERVEGAWYDRVPALEWAWLQRQQERLEALEQLAEQNGWTA